MAVENVKDVFTMEAKEDLSAYQYHAVALDDGKLATNGEEAKGILIGKPKINEFATVGIRGQIKYRAGGAVTLGGKLTVAANGWFTAADSGDYIVGEALNTVTSGSIGTGDFSFATAPYLPV